MGCRMLNMMWDWDAGKGYGMLNMMQDWDAGKGCENGMQE